MVVFFVINMCLLQGGIACQQSSLAYYNSTPELKLFVSKAEQKVRSAVGKEMVFIITPYMAYLRGEQLIYTLTDNLQLVVVPKEPRIDLKLTFTF